jgi:hypothetical protein
MLLFLVIVMNLSIPVTFLRYFVLLGRVRRMSPIERFYPSFCLVRNGFV